MTFLRLVFCFLILSSCQGQDTGNPESPSVKLSLVFKPSETFSIRGMSVNVDSEAWVSGSRGQVWTTVDGGKSWEDRSPAGYGEFDFRDIVARENFICIMTIGSPGIILRSADKGFSWQEVYRNNDSLCFLDAIEFWDDQFGLAVGDPVDSSTFLLITTDSGLSWKRLTDNLIPKLPVENAFAASGSSISLLSGGKAHIGFGGDEARVISTEDYGDTWRVTKTPLLQRDAAQGIYSICFADHHHGVVVGGNWELIHSDSVAAFTNDGGKTWNLSTSQPGGYRSCVHATNIRGKVFYATVGTSGMDISLDKGQTWRNVSGMSLNIFEFIPGTKTGFGANGKGEIFYIEFE